MKTQNQTHLSTSHKQQSSLKRPTEKRHPLTSKRKSVSEMLATTKVRSKNSPPTMPWLNADGSLKSDKEIAQLGKKWTAKTWNQYLDSNLGTLQDDELLFYENMDTEAMNERVEVLKFLQESKYYDILETALLIALAKLSKTERIIVRESFWMMATDQEVAKKIKSTNASVRNLKHRAIKKLGQFLPSKELKEEIIYLKRMDVLSSIISQRKQWLRGELLTFR